MPDVSDDKAVATAYPPEELYEDWKEEADELDMNISQFVIRMVEAGRKTLVMDLDSEEERLVRDLQEENERLKSELAERRIRIRELEDE